jgi:hypothetical protein
MNEKDLELYRRRYNNEKNIALKWGCKNLMTFNDWLFMEGLYGYIES